MKKMILLTALSIILTVGLLAEDLRLDIVFSNDVHGGIDRSEATFMNPDFPPQLGGGASAATLIKHIRSLSGTKRDMLLFDAGGRPAGEFDCEGNGWDKSADINVQVTAHRAPDNR